MELTLRTRAVIFDMDGTLVDSHAVVEAVWTVFAERFGLAPADILAVSHGRQTLDTVNQFAPPDVDHEALAIELASMEVDSAGIVEVPGATAFLAAIPADLTALVTSAPLTLATTRMAEAGVPMPRVVVPAEDVTHGKPHPDGYLRAADLLGLRPDQTVVFEDAPAGIESARAAGAEVVVVGDLGGAAADGLPRIADFTGARVEVDGSELVLTLRQAP